MIFRVIIFIGFFISLSHIYDGRFHWDAIITTLSFLAAYFKNEIQGFVGFNFISLTPKSQVIKNLNNSKFSFISEKFIHPRIIEDLNGWLSDIGDQIIAIDIINSNDSNRYFGEINIEKTKNYPKVISIYNGNLFGYQYIGCSCTGIHILKVFQKGAASVFSNIIFLTLTYDHSIEHENSRLAKKTRLIVKKVGALPLGDQYDRDIRYRLGFLIIPACKAKDAIRKKTEFVFVF